MFTGLVEEVGRVVRRVPSGRSVIFHIRGKKVRRSLRKGESIAVNGVCLTVLGRRNDVFSVQAVEETLRKTTMGFVVPGARVNLERSLLAGSRFGGHFVLGHVDATGQVVRVERRSSSRFLWIKFPVRMRKYLVPAGSIAVDGVSLTVAALKGNMFAVSIIPHTLKVTTFGERKAHDLVNLEFDVLGKYAFQTRWKVRG
ncbi:MAG: riboflavin synthase [Bacteroidia bacterium]|nr:MAG: riboflavin synthase [Bacteroidia bacterium]